MNNFNITGLIAKNSDSNNPTIKHIWFNTSDNGVITYIDLSKFSHATRIQKLEALAASGMLGVLIQRADTIYAALHERHAEQFKKVNAGLKIEGKKVEVISLKHADYLQFMSAAIDSDAALTKDAAQNKDTITPLTKSKTQHTSYDPLFFFKICFNFQKKMNDSIMKILDNMQKTQEEMDELRKEKEKKREVIKQYEKDTVTIIERKKEAQETANVRAAALKT